LRTSSTVILKVALVLLLMLTLAACNSETGTSGPSTQSTGQIQGQGLGLSKADWEKLHGPGTPNAPGFPSFQYEKNQYQVIIANDQVAQIERHWISQAVSLDMAKEESKKLYPADAKFIKSVVTASNKDNVEVFFSDMAKQAFASTSSTIPLWPGGSPGNFTVTYRQTANHQIESIVIVLGINPT